MTIKPLLVGQFEIRLLDKTNPKELEDVQRMRYQEIVLEYNQENLNEMGTDYSPYDQYCDHIIAIDSKTQEIVGTYRVMQKHHVEPLGGFLTEAEYDITSLKNSPYQILELGRAVVKKEYRGSIVLKLIWKFLFQYVEEYQIRFLFGTASFYGTDPFAYRYGLSLLYHNYLIDNEYCPKAIGESSGSMNMVELEELDSQKAMDEIPSLIKGYLAMGAKVGDGYFVDFPFKSVDVFILLDLFNFNEAYVRRLF
ncbi:MAG: GNAT family N-acetyltransferase [Bacilli bacterium]|jgi:putative hemolysin|nr:GNAT family N-acetyltransferase [Bacilli bacterium]HHU24820.1 GNAT family N-acetyltransferase [Acholeplasmataceae bacterium]